MIIAIQYTTVNAEIKTQRELLARHYESKDQKELSFVKAVIK